MKILFPKKQNGEAVIATVIAILVGLICIGAWITHVYTCFTTEKWGFLIAGAIFFPVAIVHGIGVWFGIW